MNGHGALNRIYRVVWNAALGVWQVASEITRGKGKTKSQRTARKGLASIGAGSILLLCHAGAMATLPTGGAISAGNGNISQNGSTMVIDQSSNKLAIDWQSFNVGAGNTVQFNQPSANAVALNRVMGGDPSVIHGAINANGRVFLLNPNGILFGATSKIEVASLLASTMNLSNEDFMAGNYRFEGNSDKGIVNQGQIRAADGGFIAMIAAKIENVGTMQVRGGQVVMGSGSKVRLDLGGPVRIEIDEAVIDGYIRNAGMIRADGGTVLMTVKTAGEIASMAINNEGIIQARGLEAGDGGSIRLLGDGGVVANSGTLDVSAENGKGGYVEVTGKRVGMLDGAVVDASGAEGGGTILLGGDYQGKNMEVANAQMTYIAEQAVIRANALKAGHGGKIIAWADDSTLYFGKIEAMGGAESGNGGFVEVSGKQYLDFQGQVNTSAANGSNGTLLLDPTNLTIGNVASSPWMTNQSNTFGDFTTDIDPSPSHDFSFLRVDVLLAALANNDITVLSACDAASCAGNITVIDAITWNSGKALTLHATGAITINADITATGAAGTKGGDFIAKAGSGNIAINANITTRGGAATSGTGLAGGNVNLSAASGSVVLADNAVIDTGGSAAAGSNAAGGAAGAIAINSTTGISLNGDLLARGGAGNGSGATGAGGRISLTSSTGLIQQGGGSEIAARELQLRTETGNVNLSSSNNEVERLAAASDGGNINFSNRDTAGLTVTNVGDMNGIYTSGNGSIHLSARNLQIDSSVTSQDGSITLDANHGQQSGDFSGVVVNNYIGTANGNVNIAGRGGDAEDGNQAGVVLANGATVRAGGSGQLNVTAVGGAGTAGGNHGLVIEGTGNVGAGGGLTTEAGSITVNATGGTVGDDNNAVVLQNHGRIGRADGNHSVSITTTVGAGENSTAYATDAIGGHITTGSGTLTLEGDTLSVKGDVSVDVASTGALTVKSASTSFDSPFKLSEFKEGFRFNADGADLNDVSTITIGKTGNTADIEIDAALDIDGSIRLTGGNVSLDQSIAADALVVKASGDINQSESDGGFTLNSADLASGGNITLRATGNSVGYLKATAEESLVFDNGTNALNLNGDLSAKTIGLNAGSITQSSGLLTADALKVTASEGDVSLTQANQIGKLAARVDKGSLVINGAGMADGVTIGSVDGLNGITVRDNVTFNSTYDLDIERSISAGGTMAITAVTGRDINLGTETENQLSLTNDEINLIEASKLSLTTTTGMVHNSGNVHAGSLDEIAITAQGIVNSGSGQLGFSKNAGTLNLNATGTEEGKSGIGTSTSNRLITVGAKELVLTSQRQIHVDARTTEGSAANLDKLHIKSTSAGASDSTFSVLSSGATLNLAGTGVLPGWKQGDTPTVKGTYNLSLTNSDALDFKFVGNAPIQVNSISNIDAANFWLESDHYINVANAITGTSGTITLKANSGSEKTGNFVGVNVGAALQTGSGSIVIEGRGGNGRNNNSEGVLTDRSGQHGVVINSTVKAMDGGSISITGYGGRSNAEGHNHDGVVVNSAITATNGSIEINGTGGGGASDSSIPNTSDGVVLAANINAEHVKLTGASGNGYNSRAIVQDAGNITAAGVEVISTSKGWVYLTNNNNVDTLAGDVRHGFAFDNGGNDLEIGTVNGRAGFSDTSSSELGLYDIKTLTVNESIEMTSNSTLKIAADTINIDSGKHIGSKTSSSRNVNVWLTGQAEYGHTSTRAIDVGTTGGSALGFTSALLDGIYAKELTLATTTTTTVTSDTDFKYVDKLVLKSGGTISNHLGANYLALSGVNNAGTIELIGSAIGSNNVNPILVRGADKVIVTSGGAINVEAYTHDSDNPNPVAPTDLINLAAVTLTSNSNAADGLNYRVLGAGLDYSATSDGNGYTVNANATGSDKVNFSFTGTRSITVDEDSNLKGGSLNVHATTGNVTVNDGVKIASGSASLRAAGSITFDGTASLDAGGAITLHADGSGGSLTVGSGTLSSNGNISIWADDVVLGSGSKLIANEGNGTVSIDTRADVSSGRTIQIGGGDATGSLSLSEAELSSIEAAKLVIGRNNQSYQTSGAITLAAADLTTTDIKELELRSWSGAVGQSGAFKVGSLDISLGSGAVTLNNASNEIGSFKASTTGAVSLRNTGDLDVRGVTSRGGAIDVRTTGDLLVSDAVTATKTTGASADGNTIRLEAIEDDSRPGSGKLTVLANVTSNGYSQSNDSARQGGAITLIGENVELGAATISSNGSGNAGAAGGNAGTLAITAASGGTVTLNGTTINLKGANGATNSANGLGGDLTFMNAVLLGSTAGTGTTTIDAGGGNVRFISSVNGGGSVGGNLKITSSRRTSATTTMYGDVTFQQAIGANHAIGSLDLSSVRDISMGVVNATGALTLSPVRNASVGAVNAGSVSITNTDGTTTLNGNVSTTGSSGININSKTLVASGVGYTTTGNGNIKLATKDALNLVNTSAFNSSGNIELTATDGITISGSTLTTAGKGIIFNSKTTLASNVTVDTTNGGVVAAGGNVSFLGTLDSDSTTRDLTISAGTAGNVTFGDAVGNTGALGTVTIGSANNVNASAGFKAVSFTQQAGDGTTTFGGTTNLTGGFAFAGNALVLNGALTAADGFTQSGTGTVRLGGSITTTGTDITFASPVTVNGTVVLSTGVTGDGDIRFAGALDNASWAYSGSTTLTAGAGEIVFGGDIGANTELGNLTINSSQDVTLPVSVTANSLTTNAGGSTILQDGAVVTTSGAQTYNDAVMLAGDVTTVSTGNGNIKFGSTVDGEHNLVVNTGGITTFGGAVGNDTALANLTTDAGGTTVFHGGVTTTGSQSYGDDVELTATSTFTSDDGDDITFAGKVNGGHDLIVNTTGITTFGGAVGNNQALASIDVATQAGTLLLNGGTFRTTGAQTYNSGAIILGGDTTLQSTSAGAITLNGNVDAAICTVASLNVLTQGATVFGGAIGTYRPLWSVKTNGPASTPGNTVVFAHGTVVTLGDQTYGELAVLDTNTSLKSLGQGTITFDGPVRAAQDGVQSLTIDTSGDIVFNGAVGDNDQRLASLDTGESIDGTVRINGGSVNTAGTQVYRQQVELGNNAILTGTTGTFDVGIKGNHNDLTLRFAGPTELEGTKFVNVRDLTSDGEGVTNITGTVATSGKQTYDSDVVLAADVVLRSTGTDADGDITLNGTVDGAHSLRIETEGKTDIAGTVGGTTALTSLTTDGPGVTTIGANVRTIGAQTYGDTVQMTANATLSSTGGGNIVFQAEVEGPHGLTVNTDGTTRFSGEVGGTTALASLTTDTGGRVEINGGGVTTIGAQTYGDAVTLGADTTLASTDGGDIRFNGTVDGAHALTVNTDGTTRFGGEVGGTTALASLTTDGPGATVISGGRVTTTGAQTYGDAVTLAASTVLTSEDDADIVFSDTVNGGGALTVNTGGTTRFEGEVGGDTALASLTTDAGGSVEINGGGVTTIGAQTYGDAVTLGADTTLTSTNSGNVRFNGTVDGAHALTVNTDGTTRFGGEVGGTTALASLTTDGPGATVISGGRVTTTGAQIYGDAVNLAANTVLTSTGHGDITFERTLDGAHALTVETDGDTVFNGAVGGKAALARLTTDAGGNAVINGGSVRTTGAQTFSDGVMVGANTVFTSNGPITFVDTLDGPWDIKVQTPGVTTFGGAIGSIAPVANLTGGTGRGTINLLGPSIKLSGSLTFEETVYVKHPTTVDVGGDTLFYGDAREGKALLDVTAGGRIQFGRPIDNLKAYLPALFTERNAGQSENRHMADNTAGRQLSFGKLELVNVTVGGATSSNAGGMQVDEGVVDRTVGRIVTGNQASQNGTQTYVVTVNGGVRQPAATDIQEEQGADQAI